MKLTNNQTVTRKPTLHVWDWIKTAFTLVELLRVSIASLLLPRKCFVQIYPNSVEKMGFFPGIRKDIRSYGFETSMAQKSLAVDGIRVIMLRTMLEHVSKLPDGDYAELGTYRGISARLIYQNMRDDCNLHCFDTFEGFDRRDLGLESKDVAERELNESFSDTTLERTKQYILGDDPDRSRLMLHKGFFPDTFDGQENHVWRFVQLDADLYMPTLAGLKCFFPKLVPGGVLLLHDYFSFFTGVRRAADEYFSDHGVVVVPFADKAGTGIVVKSKL
jgi:O-methyltransferase